jgi:heat-inducible transcriptional repressor
VADALRETTAALAQANDLLALATAPPASTATIHRVEVLQLQQRVVAVVAIADNGEVAKRVYTFDRPVDRGLVEWASSFLNERLSGVGIGSRIAARLDDPSLGPAERGFLAEIEGAITELAEATPQQLYMEGTARLLSESHAGDIPHPDGVVRALEGRVSVLSVLRSALRERSVFLCIGEENPEPALRSVSLVGASYGLGYRNLGAVGVVGPLRMDYARAIDSVRDAAGELSRLFATVYEG